MLGGEGVVVKDEGVQDNDGTVYALEDGRRDGGQEGPQEPMAGFGQVSLTWRWTAAMWAEEKEEWVGKWIAVFKM